jgi:hypothetical protein
MPDGSGPDPARTPAWVMELIEECAQFPPARYDDQVDSVTQALLKMRGSYSAHAATTATSGRSADGRDPREDVLDRPGGASVKIGPFELARTARATTATDEQPVKEQGASGTVNIDGFLQDDEYNSDLAAARPRRVPSHDRL